MEGSLNNIYILVVGQESQQTGGRNNGILSQPLINVEQDPNFSYICG